MSCDEVIKFTLARLRIAADTAELPKRAELLPAIRQKLVCVALVAYVEDKRIVRGVEYVVHRHDELDCAHI